MVVVREGIEEEVTTSTLPKPFVFVLMPFSDNFYDVYTLGIKPACEAAGAICERLDEQIFVESMLERIFTQISKADLIVADMTGRNPNVFYEVGYAHALNKKVILLTQTSEDIPFDLKHFAHIIYEKGISQLKNELQPRVEWHLAEENRDTLHPDSFASVQVYLRGKRIIEGDEFHLGMI